MDDEPLTEQYRALPERIARYPVTDPAARAAILAEIERQYRAALLEATEDRREAALALGLARLLAQLDVDEEPMRELTGSLEFRAR